MIVRDTLLSYLADFLAVDAIEDSCPNGMQVEGKSEISKIVTSVSASLELFKRAAEANADAVLVHHGMLWNGQSAVIKGSRKKRIQQLVEKKMNLFAYHLPLDRHPKIGNNFLAATGLGLANIWQFGKYRGKIIGYAGLLPEKAKAEQFFQKVNDFYRTKALVFPFGPSEITRVGIISGGAQEDIYDAVDEKLDVFITGEVSEYVMHIALEEGIHFVSAGHYATERLGIKALGEHIAQNFDVLVEYIDIPVPV